MHNKPQLIDMLAKFIGQRSGIDARNYRRDWNDKAGQASLMTDYRRILRDGRDARAMLRAVSMSGISAEGITSALSTGGRLRLDGDRLKYTAGQDFPTEYRAEVCRTLAGILAQHYGEEDGTFSRARAASWATRNLGRAIAGRWF